MAKRKKKAEAAEEPAVPEALPSPMEVIEPDPVPVLPDGEVPPQKPMRTTPPDSPRPETGAGNVRIGVANYRCIKMRQFNGRIIRPEDRKTYVFPDPLPENMRGYFEKI